MIDCRKFLCYMLLPIGILLFAAQLGEARMETFTGTGEYTVSDNETLQQAEDNAFKEALRAISEQVGIIVSSTTRVENAVVTYDEIVTVSSNYVKVLDKKIERSMTRDGDIHIIATVKASADPERVLSELKQISNSKQHTSNSIAGGNKSPASNTAKTTANDIPAGYQAVAIKAKAYSTDKHLSKKGLLRYLLTTGHTRSVADMIVERIDVDWNSNALAKGYEYLGKGNYSPKGIYIQLLSPNEGFTREEAFYAMTNITADWNAQALGQAKEYQRMGWNADKIKQRLLIDGFSKEEVQYALDNK